MASPIPDTYTVGSGQTIYAGLSAPPGTPAWRTAIASNTWGIASTNTLMSIDPEDNASINPNYPSNAPWHATGGLPYMTTAWGGAVFDDATGRLILPLQGGHNDYAGNEPYQILMDTDSPVWQMMRNPTGAIGNTGDLTIGENTAYYFDGRPRTIHSYNKHCFADGRLILTFQGNTSFNASTSIPNTYELNLTTWEWTQIATHPINTIASSGSASCWDTTRNKIWFTFVGTSKLSSFDLATNTWTYHTSGSSNLLGSYSNLIYIAGYDRFIHLNTGVSGGIRIWNPADQTYIDPTTTNAIPTEIGNPGAAGASWVERLGCICVWNNSTNTTKIFTLTPNGAISNPWTWGELSIDPSNSVTPTARVSNGTFTRFGYSSKFNGFYLLNNVTDPVYFFAL